MECSNRLSFLIVCLFFCLKRDNDDNNGFSLTLTAAQTDRSIDRRQVTDDSDNDLTFYLESNHNGQGS